MSTDTTHPALLRSVAEETPDTVFLETTSASGGACSVTFAELEDRSRRVAAGLLARGVRRGDRVAVAAPNHVEWLELFYGVTRIGAVLVTLNVRYREAELRFMLNQSGARLVVTSATDSGTDLRDLYAGIRTEIPAVDEILVLGVDGDDDYSSLLRDPDDSLILAEAEVGPDDPALILYTSGTTGRPKGAVLTHRSMLAAASGQVDRLGTTSADVYLCVMPLNHVGGITCSITAALLTRSAVVLPRAFSPAGTVADLDRYGVTIFAGVPTMWSLLVSDPAFASADTSLLRTAVVGGSNLEPTLADQVLAACPRARLTNLYGLSESSGAAVMSAVDDSTEQVSSTLGTPLPGVEARVVDLDGTICAAGEHGELQLRGRSIAAGYWERPDETTEAFLEEGWLRTGDMVTMDSDGHVVMQGRLKEMFVQGGYNVYRSRWRTSSRPTLPWRWRQASGFRTPSSVRSAATT